MRREMPPAFINSPASTKNGIAISGKLSAPESMFCARIWASNRPIQAIMAPLETMSAKAMGMPRVMAPRSATTKIRTIMGVASQTGSTAMGSGSSCPRSSRMMLPMVMMPMDTAHRLATEYTMPSEMPVTRPMLAALMPC
jgi:hypothetical protein